MATKTGICNLALQEIGGGRITSISDDNERSRQLLTVYGMIKAAELEANYWNFSIKRDSIAADASPPAWGYESRFSLPGDFAVLATIKNDLAYEVESGFILTDADSPLKIRYVRSDVTEGEFSGLFAVAVAMKMALSLVEGGLQKGPLMDRIERKYEKAIIQAKKVDAIQQYPKDLDETSWNNARY